MNEPCDQSAGWNEADRLKAVEAYDILDTPKEEEFEAIVKMAAQACNVPISLISFVTTGRQWFKAEIGTGLTETPLDSSICSHAILQNDLFIIPDTTKDNRTNKNPLVTGDPHVRFYAGAVLKSPAGLPLGTICVLDYKPRELTKTEAQALEGLAKLVMTQMELRRILSELRRALAAKSASEARFNFLSRLTQKLSTISSPGELISTATREVGQFLDGQRCYFFEVIPPELHTRVLPDWCMEGETTLQGEYDLAVFGEPEMWQKLNECSVAMHDVSTNPWTVPWLANYQAMNIGAALIAPFSRDGQWICCLSVSSKSPRHWTLEEQGFLEDVMARVWPLIERARIELELRVSEQRFRAMSDNIAPLAWMAKADGEVFWYNKRWLDYTGGTIEEMQGFGWGKYHNPQILPDVIASWKKAVTSGHPWEHTFPLRGANDEYRWFLSRAFPIRDEDGKITLWFGVNTDVTELNDARNALHDANRLLNDKAALLDNIVEQRTQKLSETIQELEAYSYSISHDMRSPLRAMMGYSELLQTDYSGKLDPTAVDYLNRIKNASRRLDQLIQDVLTFSRLGKQEIALGPINTEALLQQIIKTYPNFSPETVTIEIKSPLPEVTGNESLLTQSFSNLLENAKKFQAKDSKARIRIWGEVQGSRTILYIQDNGIGIAPQHFDRIFKIFQRVSVAGEGTGIGLAIVRKAVEKMGGSVGVKSEPGVGSIFWLDLQSA